MDASIILKVTRTLIGDTEPYGDSDVDRIRTVNLEKLIYVVDELLYDVEKAGAIQTGGRRMTLSEAIIHAEEVAYQKDLESEFETDNERYAMTDNERANCKKCADEHRQLAEWLKELKAYKEQSGDAIYRQAAIDAVSEACEELRGVFARCEKKLLALPSAQPERKMGKWKGYNADNPKWLRDDGSPVFLECSACNTIVMNNGSAYWNFCPNCGADMR